MLGLFDKNNIVEKNLFKRLKFIRLIFNNKEGAMNVRIKLLSTFCLLLLIQVSLAQWEPITSPKPSSWFIQSLLMFDNKIFVGFGTEVYWSSDNGLTWMPSDDGMEFMVENGSIVPRTEISPVTKLHAFDSLIYRSEAWGTIYVSSDTGKYWDILNVNQPNLLGIVDFCIQDSCVYALTFFNPDPDTLQGPILAISRNYGLSWETYPGMEIDKIGTCIGGTDTAIYVGITDPPEILKSTDQGRNWTSIIKKESDGYQGIWNPIHSLNIVDGQLIGTTAYGTIISYDDGKTWVLSNDTTSILSESEEFTAATVEIEKGSLASNYYVGTNQSRILWTPISEIITSLKSYAELMLFDYQLNQNYPNPFNSITVIRYKLKHKGNVNLTIFDLTGRKVQTLVNEFQNTGLYSVIFNADALASGIYIYKLQVGTYEQSRKMMLLR